MRTCYRCLLWLHPPAFRRQFADEMLWIFDQSADSQRALLADGAASLARQWLLRSGWWKIALAMALAVFELVLGGLGTQMFGRRTVGAPPIAPAIAGAYSGPLAHQPLTLEMVLYLAVFVFSGLTAMVIFLTFWMRNFTARRLH